MNFGGSPLGPVEVSNERQFRFKMADSNNRMNLATSSISVEARTYVDRDRFLSDVELAHKALVEVYNPVMPVRLGLRYINLIDRDVISRGLGRAVEWTTVIAEPFLRMPAGLADLSDTAFGSEVSSSMDLGAMTLRYGLQPPVSPGGAPRPGKPLKFRCDTDRYLTGAFRVEEALDKLRVFSSDCYSVFTEVMGQDLREWMMRDEVLS